MVTVKGTVENTGTPNTSKKSGYFGIKVFGLNL
jgi:hypothetical protein